MRIVIVGLGYVGAVTAACFASRGHSVTGVDVSELKASLIASGKAPVQEKGLSELIASQVEEGRLTATTSLKAALDDADVVIVSVGTPSGPSGDTDLSAVLGVCDQLANELSERPLRRIEIIITSTVPPGTLDNRIRPALEKTGLAAGTDFGLSMSPEFLREGTAIADFLQPEFVVLGCDNDISRENLTRLFRSFTDRIRTTSPSAAESVKFASNAWHGLKVAFANEIARICDLSDVDSQEVMEIFKADTRLNTSARYLSPGFAFGGSCLPKDLRTLTYRARQGGVRTPVLEGILQSNDEHLAFALRKIIGYNPSSVLVLGLAFKSGTDDLRESPAVPLVEALLGRGYRVRIFDEEIQMDRLVGANRSYVETRLPHLIDVLVQKEDIDPVDFDLVVVAQRNPAFRSIVQSIGTETPVFDLVGDLQLRELLPSYVGLAW